MKLFVLWVAALLSISGCQTMAENSETATDAVAAQGYDAQLAQQLGADDYGMKSYVLVILTTGEQDAVISDKAQRAELFKGHFANMGRLAKEGKLLLAGPLSDYKKRRGLFILNVASLEEAEALVKTDPTIKAGIFDYNLTKYYGSAALQLINEWHPKLQKKQI